MVLTSVSFTLYLILVFIDYKVYKLCWRLTPKNDDTRNILYDTVFSTQLIMRLRTANI